MATTGTRTFALENADVVEEAFERCGIDPGRLSGQHLSSARRSMQFVFSDWETKGYDDVRISQASSATSDGGTTITTAAGVLDVPAAYLRRDGIDVPMHRMTRMEYDAIPDKDQEGKPDRFYPKRNRDGTFTIYYWPAGENATDTIFYDRLMMHEDVGGAADTPDVHRFWFHALAGSLAQHLALKWAPKRFGLLKQLADEACRDAKRASRDRGDLTITAGYWS